MARILVVEDETDIGTILQVLLEFGKHEVLRAADGLEGLELARRESPDLILLDLQLPKMNGAEVNRQLLLDPKTQRIPVIVVTTESPNENSLSNAANVKRYLQKPFDPLVLLETIKEVLPS